MSNITRVLVVVASVAIGAASATAPKSHPVDRTASIGADFASTWSALIGYVSDRDWNIKVIEKDSGILQIEAMRLDTASSYMDCGSAPIATDVGAAAKINFHVSSGDQTKLTVNASFRIVRSFDGRSGTIDCTSTGKLEREIHEAVAAQAIAIANRKTKVRPDAGAVRSAVDAGMSDGG